MATYIYRKFFNFYNPKAFFLIFLFFFIWPSLKEFLWIVDAILWGDSNLYRTIYIAIIIAAFLAQSHTYQSSIGEGRFPWWHPENWPAYIITAVVIFIPSYFFQQLGIHQETDIFDKLSLLWFVGVVFIVSSIPVLILSGVLFTIFKFGHITFGLNLCYFIATYQYNQGFELSDLYILFERVVEALANLPWDLIDVKVPQLPSWSGWFLFFLNTAITIKNLYNALFNK